MLPRLPNMGTDAQSNGPIHVEGKSRNRKWRTPQILKLRIQYRGQCQRDPEFLQGKEHPSISWGFIETRCLRRPESATYSRFPRPPERSMAHSLRASRRRVTTG